MTVKAIYGRGWREAVVAPMSAAEARAADASGEPYVVLLTVRGRLDTLLRLAWRDGYVDVTRFDAQGGRISVHVFRAGGGPGLFLFESRTWQGLARHGAAGRTGGQRAVATAVAVAPQRH